MRAGADQTGHTPRLVLVLVLVRFSQVVTTHMAMLQQVFRRTAQQDGEPGQPLHILLLRIVRRAQCLDDFQTAGADWVLPHFLACILASPLT